MSKIALVTGASRGLGKDMALSLAKKGIDIILTYHSKEDEAAKTALEIEKLGQKTAFLQLSMDTQSGFETFFKNIEKVLSEKFEGQKIDFLINNAGIGLRTTLGETDEKTFDTLMNVHVKSPYFFTQSMLKYMNDGGGIINIGSGLSRFSMVGNSVYASFKAAITTMTKYWAMELGKRQIRVNTVAPGAIETDFGGGTVRDNKEINKHIAESTALGRVGLPEDIGSVVAFLCTEDSKWINGQRIEVSGGINL